MNIDANPSIKDTCKPNLTTYKKDYRMWLNGFLDDSTGTSKRKKLTGLKKWKKN